MRLAQVENDGVRAVAEVVDGSIHLLDFDGSMYDLVSSGVAPADLSRRSEAVSTAARVTEPVSPKKIVAIGLNYLDHIKETGLERPSAPLVFSIFPSAVVGPGAAIRFDPKLTARVDWEVELAVVVGETLAAVTPEAAMKGVFGYTVANDVSARDLQMGDGQWTRGKSMDTFCPLGPQIVTPDEIDDVQALRLRTRVNGEVVQESSTSEMVFGVAEILSFTSSYFTLEPGDVVLTGTPWGCGEFMDPPRCLHDGDVVEVEIDGIGTMSNPVVERSLT